MDDSIRRMLERLTWRGPLVPVEPDMPEDLVPQVRGVVRTRVFDPQDPGQADEYSRVLCRADEGFAEIRTSQIATDAAGNFRLLLVWSELYMASPKFIPAESLPVMPRLVPGASVALDDDGVPRDGDEDAEFKEALASLVRKSGGDVRVPGDPVDQEARECADASASASDRSDCLVYSEPDVAAPDAETEEAEPGEGCKETRP